MMRVSDAIWNCLVNNYANFEGRASRSEYGWVVLSVFLFVLGIFMFLGYIDASFEAIILPILLLQLLVLIPFISLCVRRLHDLGMSGWFMMLFMIPFINVILVYVVLPFIEGEGHPNQYGDVPTNKLGVTSGEPDVTKAAMDVKLGLSSYDAEKLKDAKELLDRGVITEKEFQEIKDKYLD